MFTDRVALFGVGTVKCMSKRIELDAVGDEVTRWGFGYLTTVSDDGRPHVIALVPSVADASAPVLRFDAGGGRACRNAAQRGDVAVVFPPSDHSDGFGAAGPGGRMAGTSSGLGRDAP